MKFEFAFKVSLIPLVLSIAACDSHNPQSGITRQNELSIPVAGGSSGAVIGAKNAPFKPIITGEASAGHKSLYWSWTRSVNTVYFMVKINQQEAFESVSNSLGLQAAGVGSHTLSVSSCDSSNRCSEYESFLTKVEYFGMENSIPWRGVAKSNLTTSALGNIVPISCHNCYGSSLSATLDRVHTAIGQAADLIELDIVEADGELCVVHDDLSRCSSRGTLPQVLSDSDFRASSSMLFIEIKERQFATDEFAEKLLSTLNENRDYIKNGRLVVLRSFDSGISYLQMIATKMLDPKYSHIREYLRFSILYGQNSAISVGSFQSKIYEDVVKNQFHFVEFNYQTSNLPGLVKYAQSWDLGVGIYTLPAGFGSKVFISAMREEVDQITTDFQIDLAREAAEKTNTLAYLNASTCNSAGDTSVSLYRNVGNGLMESTLALGYQGDDLLFGAPPLIYDSQGEDRFGCSLDFRHSLGNSNRALNIGHHRAELGGGFLVSAYVNFDKLGSLDGTMAILNSSEAGGFALELHNSGSGTKLRFGVHIDGQYRYHSYDVSDTGLNAQNRVINGGDGYFLIGAYDGDGGVYLWVNNYLNGNGGYYSGEVTGSSQATLVGADPQPNVPTKARFGFDGLIQQVSVLSWK